MLPASRRLWLPWLLLLVPTLLIGAATLWLLGRERQRLEAARKEAQAHTVTAVRARAQVAADNIELLVSEIRDGLLRELAETPEADLEALLANWPRTNPLVAETFLWHPDRRALAWPPDDSPAHTLFRQRHAGLFRGTAAEFSVAARQQEKVQQAHPASRSNAAPFLQNSEVASNQLLRRDVQLSTRNSAIEAKSLAGKTEDKRLYGEPLQAPREVPAKDSREPNSRPRSSPAEARASPESAAITPAPRDRSLPPNGPPPPMDVRTAPWGEPASGWLGRTGNGTVYFLGWWQPAGGGAVRGVELNLPAVLERVQALVPAPGGDGERFALRGPGDPADAGPVSIPLATTLPGWRLAAQPGGRVVAEGSGEGAFFAVGALLVLAFGTAILAGGTLFFRQAAAAAREAALKTGFVANVSHEMKTPLTTIRMYAEMLADERVADPEKRRRYFATIGRETTRLARLVNNALDFGRLEAGRREYRAETVPLAPWLDRLAEVHAPRLAEAGVGLAVAPAPAAAAVRCDADSLDQMALNLLDNAVKYAAAGGAVDVRVEPQPAAWALVVADRGPGVATSHRERIFERFHRIDDALTAKATGTGLGLTIARRLARDQGGELAYRDRPGGGAEFVLTLPAAPA